jgi:hypothetical protein
VTRRDRSKSCTRPPADCSNAWRACWRISADQQGLSISAYLGNVLDARVRYDRDRGYGALGDARECER